MNYERFRAALVDMDGTLYDSMPSHARAWHRMVGEMGIDSTVDEFFLYEGMTGRATIDLLFRRAYGHGCTADEAKELYAKKTQYFRELPPVNPMPGARKLMGILRNRGIPTVLVTGSGQSSLIGRLDQDYPNIFPADRRVTAHDVTHGKPHPEPFVRAAEIAGVPPRECLVVENAPLGVESAHKAGCYTVAVNTGPIAAEKLWEAGADQVFDDMEQACQWLAEVWP